MHKRKCTKCRNNPGIFYRWNGFPDVCYTCFGTGFVTVYTKEERAQLEADGSKFSSALKVIVDRSIAMDGYDLRYRVINNLWELRKHEPERLTKLYRSIETGRLDDVIKALDSYTKS